MKYLILVILSLCLTTTVFAASENIMPPMPQMSEDERNKKQEYFDKLQAELDRERINLAPIREKLATSPFLIPYIEILKKETKTENLIEIKKMKKDDLIDLHFDYGMYIRNKWLRGNREPKLIQFFRNNGIKDADSMSGIIIHALWLNLNQKR